VWFTIPIALATSLGLAGVARQRPITWLTLPRGVLRWRCRSYLTTASGGGLKFHIINSRSGGAQCCQTLAARSRLGFASGVGLDAGRRIAGLRISSGLARPAAGCVSHPRRGSDPELGMDAGGRSAGLRIYSGLACADPRVGLHAGQRYAALTLADAAQACKLTAACRVLQHGCGATLGEAQILESGKMLADAPQACGLAAAWLVLQHACAALGRLGS